MIMAGLRCPIKHSYQQLYITQAINYIQVYHSPIFYYFGPNTGYTPPLTIISRIASTIVIQSTL